MTRSRPFEAVVWDMDDAGLRRGPARRGLGSAVKRSEERA